MLSFINAACVCVIDEQCTSSELKQVKQGHCMHGSMHPKVRVCVWCELAHTYSTLQHFLAQDVYAPNDKDNKYTLLVECSLTEPHEACY